MSSGIRQVPLYHRAVYHRTVSNDDEGRDRQSMLDAAVAILQKPFAKSRNSKQTSLTSASPIRQMNVIPLQQNHLSAYKLKRQPFQCLVNVVSCWKWAVGLQCPGWSQHILSSLTRRFCDLLHYLIRLSSANSRLVYSWYTTIMKDVNDWLWTANNVIYIIRRNDSDNICQLRLNFTACLSTSIKQFVALLQHSFIK